MMLIGTIAALSMALAVPPAPAEPAYAVIGQATDALLEATPALGEAEFRNVRIVRLPARHQAVCGEVGASNAFRRFAYDTVTKVALTEGSGSFPALWANCGS